MVSHSLDPSVTEANARYGIRIRDDVKDRFGLHAMGGAEYRVTRSFSIGVTVFHLFYETKVKTTAKVTEYNSKSDYLKDYTTETNLNLDMDLVMMTVKYKW